MKNTRMYPSRPVVAVSGVIPDSSHRILLVRRARAPGRGLWSLPGGVVKLGESLHDALHREIREECSISVKIVKLLGAFDRIFWGENSQVAYHYVILNYLCSPQSTVIKTNSDADSYAWVTKSNINEFDFAKGVKEFLLEGFEKNWF